MKLVLSALLAGSAASFAPTPVSKGSCTSMSMSFESELGAQEPIGFWDPLGLVADGDQDTFDRLRYVEIKHGRIAQLAFLGRTVTQAGIRLPGNIDYDGTTFESIPAGIKALGAIPQGGLFQIVAFIGFLELFVMKDVTGLSEFEGDIRNGFDFGWDTFTEEEKLQKRAIELNNGRAAMMGILGLMVHEELGTAVPLEGLL